MIKIIRHNHDSMLKRGWIIKLDSDDLIQQYGTTLWKVINVTEFGARIVPFKQVAYMVFDDKADEESFYNTLRPLHISARSEVPIVFKHYTNLELGS